MRKVFLRIGAAALVLGIACLVVFLLAGHSARIVFLNPQLAPTEGWVTSVDSLRFQMDREGVAEVEAVRIEKAGVMVRVRAVAPGKAYCTFYLTERGIPLTEQDFRVSRNRFILANEVNVGGFCFYIIAAGLFLAAVCWFFLRYFISVRGSGLYSYTTIFACGMAIFTGSGAVSILLAGIRHWLDPASFSELSALNSIAGTADACMWYLALPILVFSLAMIVSNIELLRHESVRLPNILGVAVGAAMILGLLLPILAGLHGFSGSFEEYRVHLTMEHIYSTIYTYFACMLGGAAVSAFRAVRREPAFDKDYIVILGCGFNADGSLPPLLRGRCDRAVSFREKQMEATGKQAVLIPSGGQGPDEPMPEAEAMARYLISRGVPESDIIREDQSRNTSENMAFSRRIIEERDPQAKAVFSTTNYHVFRSGLLAARAGLDAEGIGAGTKWWFWPNAFMREVAGLTASRFREEAVLLAVTVAISVLLTWLTAR